MLTNLQLPIVEWAIAVGRLRFAAKVSRRPPDFLTALLQGVSGEKCRSAVASACRALQQLLPDKLGAMPDPLLVMSEREQLWSRYPAEWSGLFCTALQRASADP